MVRGFVVDEVPSLDGSEKMKVPGGTETAGVFKLRGKGIKSIKKVCKFAGFLIYACDKKVSPSLINQKYLFTPILIISSLASISV
jgi:DnaJ-class molecular chaperone